MKILILAMLCVASVACVKLENICSADTFQYKGVLVNAVYRVQTNVTFQPISLYMINDSVKCDPAEFEVKRRFVEALTLKNA